MSSIYPQRVRFGPFEADLDTHELWKNGVKLKLGGQPFEILAILLNRPGQLVSREELQKELWAADTFVDFNHGLNAAVNKLRETLSDSAEEPKYIETLPRRGYRFIGKIENAVADVARPAPPPVPVDEVLSSTTVLRGTGTESSEAAQAPPMPSVASARRHSRVRSIGRMAAAAILVLAGAVVWRVANGRRAQVLERIEQLQKLGAIGSKDFLTLVPDPASDPAISPDGKQVAFRRNSYTPGAAGIFVTSSTGKALRQMTTNPGDCCPAWSPDGKQLAFTRIAADEYAIFVMNADGGEPRKITHEDPRKKRGEIAWTNDGKYIAFSGDSPRGGSQIFLISVENSSLRAITEPQGQDRDWGPAFSPDGSQMAFVRANGAGFPEEIYVVPMTGGPGLRVAYSAKDGKKTDTPLFVTTAAMSPARQLTNLHAAILGPPTWTADGQSIVFSSTKIGDPTLWRIPAVGGDGAQIGPPGGATWHPSISRQDNLLVAQKILRSSGIYRVELKDGSAQQTTTIVTSTNGRNEGPQISPDGKRLLFMSDRSSDRSGGTEIWVSNRDGSEAKQLTSLHGCGTPRWSPDGKWVVFDAGGAAAQGIYVVSADGGTPRAVIADGFENSVPNWSRDGEWIYFGSNRSGKDQLWKIRASGGHAAQVTTDGGFAAWESMDGKTVYYAKTRYDNPEIWKMPVRGGTEQQVSGAIRPRSWAAWGVTREGIYFSTGTENQQPPSLNFYGFENHLTKQLALLDKDPFWLSVSADGKEIFYDQAGQDESSVVLVKTYK